MRLDHEAGELGLVRVLSPLLLAGVTGDGPKGAVEVRVCPFDLDDGETAALRLVEANHPLLSVTGALEDILRDQKNYYELEVGVPLGTSSPSDPITVTVDKLRLLSNLADTF